MNKFFQLTNLDVSSFLNHRDTKGTTRSVYRDRSLFESSGSIPSINTKKNQATFPHSHFSPAHFSLLKISAAALSSSCAVSFGKKNDQKDSGQLLVDRRGNEATSRSLTFSPLTLSPLKKIMGRPVINCAADIPHEFIQFAGELVIGGACIDNDAPAETVIGAYHQADGAR